MARAPFKHATKQFGSVVAAIVCLLTISIVTAFANAGLDPTKIRTTENITNMALNAVTTVFGIIVAIPLGVVSTKQMQTPNGGNGKYLTAYAAYNKIRQAIEPKRTSFSQWHQLQHRKEQHQKCVNYLLEHNIEQAEDVMKLSREQILQLTTSQKFIVDGQELYFKALTHEQIRAINNVLSGRVTVHKLPDFYFLCVDGFVIASIFTSLVISKLSEDITTREYVIKVLVTVFARVFNAISSVYWGFQIGQEQVYRQCYYINGKTQFLELYDADTDFIPKSLQEQAKEDYETTKGDVTNDVQN